MPADPRRLLSTLADRLRGDAARDSFPRGAVCTCARCDRLLLVPPADIHRHLRDGWPVCCRKPMAVRPAGRR